MVWSSRCVCSLMDSPLMACFDHSYFCLCQFLACSLGHSDGGAPCSLSVGTGSLVAPCTYTHRWGKLAAHAWVGRDFSGGSLFAGLMVFSPLRRVTARNLTLSFDLPCLALPCLSRCRQDHAAHSAQDRRRRGRQAGRHVHAGRPFHRRGEPSYSTQHIPTLASTQKVEETVPRISCWSLAVESASVL